ncbi:PilW family protein [uncultured Thiodictyon sp.]|uniref:PilW family protein n=1 Tax=uncultured Thiodictyon sp. TaxID=1846217 RepID=UPI0025EA859E|nr:PilW family protein [uncultured Thiodictyon sp.]
MLIAAVGAVFFASNQSSRTAQDAARIQETGRYALDLIGRNLRQAGYINIPFGSGTVATAFTGTPITTVSSACPAAPTMAFAIQYQGIAGELDCQAQAITGQIVQQTFFIGVDATTGTFSLRCNAVQAATPPTPPTACPTAAAATNDNILLDNIEDLRILYGSDTSGNQSVDSYSATPANWSKVVTARVCVLVRSDSESATERQGSVSSPQTYFNCDGALGTATGAARYTTATDTRQRRAFVATFALRNRISSTPD